MPELENLMFIELASVEDLLLLPWLDLYETAFPPEERELVSVHLEDLREIEQGRRLDVHMIAVLNDQSEFVGMVKYEINRECGVAFLWYLAVDERFRGRGIGKATYMEILGEIKKDTVKAVIIEVEIPGDQPDRQRRTLAERRIEFYRRLGAGLLGGVRYMMSVGPHQPPVPFHLMVHPLEEMSAEEAWGVVLTVLDDSIERIGELTLT